MSDRIFCGLLGFFVGGLLGGYLVGRMCGKEYKKRMDDLKEENEKLSKEVESYDSALDDIEDPFANENNSEDDVDSETDVGILSRKYGSDRFNKEMERYTGPSESSKDPNDIHIIDAESFRRDIETRDNETLTYYQEDGVLVDSANNVIRNEEQVIGVEAMEKIFDCGEDVDYVYVSDEEDDKMYEIAVEHTQSYYRDVMGV